MLIPTLVLFLLSSVAAGQIPEFPQGTLDIPLPKQQRLENGQIAFFNISGPTNPRPDLSSSAWKSLPMIRQTAGFCVLQRVRSFNIDDCAIWINQVTGASEPYWVLHAFGNHAISYCGAMCFTTVNAVLAEKVYTPDCTREGQQCQNTCNQRGYNSYDFACKSPGPTEHGTCICV